MNKTTPTATRRILNALRTGSDFTTNQLRNRFGITNVSARISELRKAGFPVYLNTKTTDSGDSIRVYALGTPTRSTVVAGQVFSELAEQGLSWVNVNEVADIVNDRLYTAF